LSLVSLPLTKASGPIVAYNLLCVICPALANSTVDASARYSRSRESAIAPSLEVNEFRANLRGLAAKIYVFKTLQSHFGARTMAGVFPKTVVSVLRVAHHSDVGDGQDHEDQRLHHANY
jgi:hypothetical protein